MEGNFESILGERRKGLDTKDLKFQISSRGDVAGSVQESTGGQPLPREFPQITGCWNPGYHECGAVSKGVFDDVVCPVYCWTFAVGKNGGKKFASLSGKLV